MRKEVRELKRRSNEYAEDIRKLKRSRFSTKFENLKKINQSQGKRYRKKRYRICQKVKSTRPSWRKATSQMTTGRQFQEWKFRAAHPGRRRRGKNDDVPYI